MLPEQAGSLCHVLRLLLSELWILQMEIRAELSWVAALATTNWLTHQRSTVEQQGLLWAILILPL